MELARHVNLNDFKLKLGFRQVFGTSVFGYLRQWRMEQARLLLEEAKMNVAQASSSVGYTNPSHFAAAFKKQFGINPGSILVAARQAVTKSYPLHFFWRKPIKLQPSS